MINKIKLAVFLEHNLMAGGSHHQSLNAVNLMRTFSCEEIDTIFVVTEETNKIILKDIGIDSIVYRPTKFAKLWLNFISLISFDLLKYLRKFIKYNSLERFLKNYNIDLVYFTSQSGLAACLESTNYIYTLYDLCHRDYPEFPEVRHHRQFESRELHFRRVLPKALAVLCESALGKCNAINRYGLDHSRVHVLPMSPALNIRAPSDEQREETISIKNQYKIDSDYIFYPAQFWAHKNHIYILQGMKWLEASYGIRVSAIFSGSDKGNLSYIKEMARQLGIYERVRFTGFVSNTQMRYLYEQSLALVMPTYFGPTNLPPLEAFALGVPVLYSDLPGLREQVGDAALLLDLDNPENLAINLKNIISDLSLRRRLIESGFKRLTEIDSPDENRQVITSIIRKFLRRRRCWG
jgi:glycosyltransferase involved in cell wall biosynthesis